MMNSSLIAAGLYAGLLSGLVLVHPFILGIGDGGSQVVLFSLMSTVAIVCAATVFRTSLVRWVAETEGRPLDSGKRGRSTRQGG